MMASVRLLLLILSTAMLHNMGQAFPWPKCPTEICTCETHMYLGSVINCTSRNLTEVPTFEPVDHNWGQIDLSNNLLTEIPGHAFIGNIIKQIDLGHNTISVISETGFSGLESCLEMLLLDDNEIETLPEHVFRALGKLTWLKVSYNSIANMGKFPGSQALKTLELEGCGLGSIPDSSFLSDVNNLESLDLGSNNIVSFQDGYFQEFPNLKSLFLTDNEISEIPTRMFENMTKIYQLHMTRNRLVSEGLDGLNKLTDLSSLSLAYNQITSFNSRVIQGIDYLTMIYLQGNSITQLNSSFGEHFWKNMVRLNMNNNDIELISDDAFGGLEDIRDTLVLSNNKLWKVPVNALKNINVCTKLDLSNNHIEMITQEDIDLLPREADGPSSLTFSGNPVQNLPASFSSQWLLGTLGISNMSLTHINTSAFANNQILGEVDASNNSIVTIDACNVNPSLTKLMLERNPLFCGCHLKWLRQSGVKLAADMEQEQHLLCDSPVRLQGRLVMELNKDEFECNISRESECSSDANTGHRQVLSLYGYISMLLTMAIVRYFVKS